MNAQDQFRLENLPIKKILFSYDDLQARCTALGVAITKFYADKVSLQKPLQIIGLLNGCLPFLTLLQFAIKLPVIISFIQVNTYFKCTSTRSDVQIQQDLLKNEFFTKIRSLSGRYYFLVVDDIYETGRTFFNLFTLMHHFPTVHVASVVMCARVATRPPHYQQSAPRWVGFHVEEQAFLVGCGLDYQFLFRNLPFVSTIDVAKIKVLDHRLERSN